MKITGYSEENVGVLNSTNQILMH